MGKVMDGRKNLTRLRNLWSGIFLLIAKHTCISGFFQAFVFKFRRGFI